MSISTAVGNQFRKVATPQPSNIISAADVSSPEINELRKINEQLKAQVADKQKELADNLALQESRLIQSQHDKAEALKAKVQSVEQDTSGISIVRNNLTQSDLIECQMLAILNAKRVSTGQQPYKDYTEYLNSFIDTPAPITAERISIVPTTKNDPVTPLDKLAELWLDYEGRPLKANGDVYQIVNGGYYLCWNKSRCYIQKTETSDVNILVIGDTQYGDSILMAMIPNKSFRDLTRAEVDNIIKGKPSYKELFKVYSKLRNFQNVYLDVKNALPVW
jgi:hypothetical protein